MDIRYGASPKDMKRYTTEELRREVHISDLFQADGIRAVYSHVDRMVTFGCMPVTRPVALDDGIDVMHNFGTHYILERREIGIFNVGGNGSITCDGTEYKLGYKDCLYVTMGTETVTFSSENPEAPARFYMVSAPAHKPCKTTLLSLKDAKKVPCGSAETANDRVINQFIHPEVLETCQLSMGMTALKTGSVWNTMPAHTHERRMEIYFYFEIPENNVVFHMMGQPQETRHVVMQNNEAVISPSWSIHAGCGTANYTFIWAMGGENKTFTDMDEIKTTALR